MTKVCHPFLPLLVPVALSALSDSTSRRLPTRISEETISSARLHFYGQTLVVNGKTGYAHNDGNFRTTDGTIVGKFGDDGSLYPLGGKLLPQPKQYSGPCNIAKMVYHIQMSKSLSSPESVFKHASRVLCLRNTVFTNSHWELKSIKPTR